MTYRELAEMINGMTEEQQNSDITVEATDGVDSEFFPAKVVITDNDVLDTGHPVITIYTSL